MTFIQVIYNACTLVQVLDCGQRLMVVDRLSLIDSVGFASRKVTSVGDYRVL